MLKTWMAGMNEAGHDEVRSQIASCRRAMRKPWRLPGLLLALLTGDRSAPEQHKQQNDRKWNSEQPQQCALTKAHGFLLSLDCVPG
jgi:hypothetical protein